MQLDASTSEAEDLFFAEFYIWESNDGSQDLATESYHVPAHVQEHIDYVTPGVRLRNNIGKRAKGTIKPKFSPTYREDAVVVDPHSLNSSTCAEYITAGCVQSTPVFCMPSHSCSCADFH